MAGIFRMTSDHTPTDFEPSACAYDLLLGVTERYNQNAFGFPQCSNPSSGRQSAYAANPIPNWSAANFSVKGGIFFATPDNSPQRQG